jgi:4-amino-4-deoxy-L-arabinose transferase-like glycosyltransferase
MLLALPWVSKRDDRFLPAAGALLGAAALAKGLVPLALAAPLAMRIGWIRDWLRPRVLLPFFAVAAPWYVLCYLRNGWAFIDEFFVRHHFGRFTSGELLHARPWWFYLEVLPLLLLPWAPLLLLAAVRGGWNEPRRRFLAVWAIFGLVVFSAGINKLPGYVLPLLPAIAALAGLALDELEDARRWLAVCALLLVLFPIAAPILPAAVANEWESAPRIAFHWSWLLPAIPVAAVVALEGRGRRPAAVLAIACSAAVGMAYLKLRTQPEMERVATARSLAAEIDRYPDMVCAGELKRDWQYGLYYYTGRVLPSCDSNPRQFQVLQTPGQPPGLVRAAGQAGTGRSLESVDPR